MTSKTQIWSLANVIGDPCGARDEIERLQRAWDGIFGERDPENAAQWVAELLANQRPAVETAGYRGDSLSKLISDMRTAANAARAHQRDGVAAFVTQWIERLDALAAPETGDALDAARYRFLRQPGNAIVYAKDRNAWGSGASGHVRYDTAEQLDTAVDVARGEEKTGGSL